MPLFSTLTLATRTRARPVHSPRACGRAVQSARAWGGFERRRCSPGATPALPRLARLPGARLGGRLLRIRPRPGLLGVLSRPDRGACLDHPRGRALELQDGVHLFRAGNPTGRGAPLVCGVTYT